jgi:uncharacterized coiled-coil protein SlyX
MQEASSSVPTSATQPRVTIAALLILIVAVAAYAFHERNVSKQLVERNGAVTSALNATHDQINALTARLDAMNAERAADKPAPTHPGVYRKPMNAAATRHRIDDPRWKKMQGQLDDQAKQIDTTRQDLTSARTELQGSIATTHDQLVLLEKKGERSYFEFDLDKGGQFQREGPVGVRLRKANTKNEYADLEMMVDDFKVSKKHVNIYEPVVFYSADSKMPVELVINSISKNHIHGYVSEPKYKGRDLEAMANSSPNNSATGANGSQTAPTAKPSPARQRLELPRN